MSARPLEGKVIETLSALLVVLSAIVLLRVALGASGLLRRATARRSLRVVESCALGGRQRLHVVDVGGERLLLGAAEGSITLLRRLERPAPMPEPAREAAPAARGWRDALRAGMRALLRATPLALVLLVAGGGLATAQTPPPLLPDLGDALQSAVEPERVSSTLQIVTLLTLISVAPSILLMGTCFTRVLIVLAFLRQAIGIHQLPPSQVLVGLALFLTLFVMAPVGQRIHGEALAPYVGHQIDAATAAERAVVPVRQFLEEFTREKDLALFASLAGSEAEASDPVPLSTLLPAYMLSELRAAFQIGFMIYLPFLVIDLVIASMLISMGMIVLPPIVISLPFKLMLFVLLDGWNLVIGSLVTGLR